MEIHIERGRIRAVLPNVAGTIIRTENQTFNYPGACVVPGFVDNHGHVVGLGTRLSQPSLHQAESISDCLEILRNAPASGLGWILAMGWNETKWAGEKILHKSILDEAFPDVAVVAMRIDGHSAWVNSEALRRADIKHSTGVLRESEAQAVLASMPSPTVDDLQNIIALSAQYLVQKGITEVHDMDVHPEWIDAFRDLAERGQLPVRVQTFVSAQNDDWVHNGILPSGGEFNRIAGIKLYADGALGSRTAALFEPYRDDDANNGMLLLTAQQIVEKVRTALNANWLCVAVHAIGDRAAHEAVNAFEIVRSWSDGKDITLRLEHAQLLKSDDVKRLADLGVWCCVQPSHLISDSVMAEQRLSPFQLAGAYRWKSILDAGGLLAAGSDFPIEMPDPLLGIETFVNPKSVGFHKQWHNAECITAEEALKAFTTWGHQSADMGYRRGVIDVGYDADFTVLDRDPRSTNASDIHHINVLATFVAGQIRYRA